MSAMTQPSALVVNSKVMVNSVAELIALLRETAERHIVTALPHVAGDYMGEHWLATYALMALGPVD